MNTRIVKPGAFNMLILLLLAVPISHGRHYDELGTNKEKQERAADEDFLSRLIDEQPQNSDTTKDNSASTQPQQSCRTYASFTVRSLHEDACERNLTQALECVTSPEEKLATCRKIPKCDCGPRCRKCTYRRN